MGKIVYGTLATDARVLVAAASELAPQLAEDSARAGAHFLLGAAYEQLGRFDDAMRAHERSVRIDPDRPEALRALAYVYALTGRAHERGGEDVVDSLYRRALALQPAIAWVRAEHGDFLHERGRMADAERAYRDALREQPSLAVGWFHLGLLLTAAGRHTEAVSAFREATRLDPQLAQAFTALFEISGRAGAAEAVRSLAPPVTSLPMRSRAPSAVQPRVSSDGRSLAFVNVPHTAIVQIFRVNGTLMRTVRSQGTLTTSWDMRTDRGVVIGPALYRVRVLGRNVSEQPVPPQNFLLAIVRRPPP
jgi:tetratricopeptide (TPR) repeat protein